MPDLKLRDGTPIKGVWKWNSKGTLGRGLGWTGRRNANGKFKELRSLTDKFERLEIWLGYDHKAADKALKAKDPLGLEKGWRYYRHLIPNGRTLQHLKRMGLEFTRDKRKPAPAFCQEKSGEEKTLRELIIGKPLPPFSVKVGSIRRGEIIKLHFAKGNTLVPSEKGAIKQGFYVVSALKADGAVEFKPLTDKEAALKKASDLAVLAFLKGLDQPWVVARKLGRRIPARAEEKETSVQRKKGTSKRNSEEEPTLGI